MLRALPPIDRRFARPLRRLRRSLGRAFALALRNLRRSFRRPGTQLPPLRDLPAKFSQLRESQLGRGIRGQRGRLAPCSQVHRPQKRAWAAGRERRAVFSGRGRGLRPRLARRDALGLAAALAPRLQSELSSAQGAASPGRHRCPDMAGRSAADHRSSGPAGARRSATGLGP